ncbi:protein Eaa, partial [Salmonella enterica]|nr:protein Eaa [Salmonella enterica]
MTTITREQLIEKLQNRIAVTANYPGVEEAQLDAAIFKIALASLEAKPIGAFHIADQQVDGTTDYIKDGEWPIDNGVIDVYAAPPAPVATG